jgi:uncharacterized membrane protein (UPF0127 family)
MKIQRLTSLPEKLLGLSFKENIQPVYFETRFGIHTFFVKKAIDVVICDDDFIVRKIVRSMKPWKVLIWNPKYKKVLELPTNYKKYSKITIGDKIDIT